MNNTNNEFINHLHSMYRFTQMSGQSSTSITVDCFRKIIEVLAQRLDSQTINVDSVNLNQPEKVCAQHALTVE